MFAEDREAPFCFGVFEHLYVCKVRTIEIDFITTSHTDVDGAQQAEAGSRNVYGAAAGPSAAMDTTNQSRVAPEESTWLTRSLEATSAEGVKRLFRVRPNQRGIICEEAFHPLTCRLRRMSVSSMRGCCDGRYRWGPQSFW